MHYTTRISIGIPVYNGDRYITEAIDSMLGQSFQDFELLISDNASSDGTEAICREYAAKDPRIHYFRNHKNLGATFNHNTLVRCAKGQYFKWVSADDIYASDFLKKCIESLNENRSAILAYSKSANIDKHGNLLKINTLNFRNNSNKPYERFHDFIMEPHNCNPIFGLIRRRELLKTKLLRNYISADRVLLSQLALMGKFHKIPETLMFWRRHSKSSTIAYSSYTRYQWWDPDKAGQIVFPAWRLILEYVKVANRVPLKFHENIFCLKYILEWAYKNKHRLKADLDYFVNHLKNPDKALYKDEKEH